MFWVVIVKYHSIDGQSKEQANIGEQDLNSQIRNITYGSQMLASPILLDQNFWMASFRTN